MSARLQELSGEEWKVVIGNNGFCGFDRILPYLNEETIGLVKNHTNDYRYYVIMNDEGTVSKQELEELKQELEKVIARIQRKGNVKSIFDDVFLFFFFLCKKFGTIYANIIKRIIWRAL